MANSDVIFSLIRNSLLTFAICVLVYYRHYSSLS